MGYVIKVILIIFCKCCGIIVSWRYNGPNNVFPEPVAEAIISFYLVLLIMSNRSESIGRGSNLGENINVLIGRCSYDYISALSYYNIFLTSCIFSYIDMTFKPSKADEMYFSNFWIGDKPGIPQQYVENKDYCDLI